MIILQRSQIIIALKQKFQIFLPLFFICFFLSSICSGTINLKVSSSGRIISEQPGTATPLISRSLKANSSRTIIPNLLKNSGSNNTLDGWRAKEGITLEPSENDGVRISGTQQSGWNYAVISLSDSHIEPGAIYRLEAWMKVDDISDNRYPHI